MYQFNVDQTANRIKLGSLWCPFVGCKVEVEVVAVVLLTYYWRLVSERETKKTSTSFG